VAHDREEAAHTFQGAGTDGRVLQARRNFEDKVADLKPNGTLSNSPSHFEWQAHLERKAALAAGILWSSRLDSFVTVQSIDAGTTVRFLAPEEYQPLANAVYETVSARLRAALPNATIEHIGSSAIPGTISKGDLDVFVAVSAGDFLAAIESIKRLGFKIKTDTLRTPQLCPFEGRGFPLDVAIQLVERGSRFEFFRRFRDLLKGDSALLERYNRLKQDAAPLDEVAYRALKGIFIEAALASEGPPEPAPFRHD